MTPEQEWTLSHLKADQIIFSNKTSGPIAALYFHPKFKDQNEVDLMKAMLSLLIEKRPATTVEGKGTMNSNDICANCGHARRSHNRDIGMCNNQISAARLAYYCDCRRFKLERKPAATVECKDRE